MNHRAWQEALREQPNALHHDVYVCIATRRETSISYVKLTQRVHFRKEITVIRTAVRIKRNKNRRDAAARVCSNCARRVTKKKKRKREQTTSTFVLVCMFLTDLSLLFTCSRIYYCKVVVYVILTSWYVFTW